MSKKNATTGTIQDSDNIQKMSDYIIRQITPLLISAVTNSVSAAVSAAVSSAL